MRFHVAILSVLVALVGATRTLFVDPVPTAPVPAGDIPGIVLDAEGRTAQGVVIRPGIRPVQVR